MRAVGFRAESDDYPKKGLDMTEPYKGFRLPWDVLQQIEASCAAQGLSFSDWIRQAALTRLVSEANGNPDLAYAATRSLVIPIVKAVIHRALEVVPNTYEEAMAQLNVYADQQPPNPYGG